MRAPPCLLALAALAFAASAAAEPLIYEGHLDGLPDGAATVDLRFALYAEPAAGEPVWVSDDLTLDVDDGRFVAELQDGPDGMLEPYHFAGSRWLEVTVLPPDAEAVTLAPRQRIGWTPSAFDPTIKARSDDGIFLVSVHCGQGAHAPGAAMRFDDLHAAVRWLDDKRIAEGTTVHIAVLEDCALPEALRIEHPDGQQIELVGEPGGLEPPILSFAGDGIIVGRGHRLGSIRGFRIHRIPARPDGPVSWGLKVEQGSLVFADDLTVSGFFYGIATESGGTIIDPTSNEGDPLIAVANGTGFGAYWGGNIRAPYAEAHGNHGPGMTASGNGTLHSTHATAEGNHESGFVAVHGGVMRLVHSAAVANTHHGFVVSRSGHMYADYTTSEANEQQGFMATVGGSMDASISIAERNNIGYLATTSGVISASRSYSVENAAHALQSILQGMIYFRCGAWSDREGQQNPGGPREGPYLSMSDPPAANAGATIHADDEGVVDALGCTPNGEVIAVNGDRLTRGHVAHPSAAAMLCCGVP